MEAELINRIHGEIRQLNKNGSCMGMVFIKELHKYFIHSLHSKLYAYHKLNDTILTKSTKVSIEKYNHAKLSTILEVLKVLKGFNFSQEDKEDLSKLLEFIPSIEQTLKSHKKEWVKKDSCMPQLPTPTPRSKYFMFTQDYARTMSGI